MESVKVIDISSLSNKSKSKKKLTKKQLYKEILSSSDKVKEIISNRKKTHRFDYLNSQSYPTITSNQKQETKENIKNNKNLEGVNQKKEVISEKPKAPEKYKKKIRSPKKRSSKSKDFEDKNSEKAKITNYFKKELATKQVTFTENANQSIKNSKNEVNLDQQTDNKSMNENSKEDTLPNPEQTIISALQKTKPILKKNNQKFSPKRKSPKNQVQRSKIKKFNDKQIIDLLTILIKLNKLGEIIKIHRTIRRINKYQVNQLLYSLRLIKKWSNAPVNMLKNTLFTYITGDIKIV
jgi:chemotaxis protein histidine kinase CheA